MMSESEKEEFFQWMFTVDREEYIQKAPKFFPGMSREEAEEMANEVGKREFPGQTTPDEPEKEHLELLLELVDVEDEAEREAIYDKTAEHEMRRMQEEKQKPKGG